ncbi:unnamed protein product, partial [Heterotrigona itama]
NETCEKRLTSDKILLDLEITDIKPEFTTAVSASCHDDGNSNKSQVTLRDVDFALSGTFSCEVTADAPTFSTAYVSKNLTVVCKYTLHDITEYRGQLDAFNVLVCLPTQRPRSLLATLLSLPDARDSRVCRIVSHRAQPLQLELVS